MTISRESVLSMLDRTVFLPDRRGDGRALPEFVDWCMNESKEIAAFVRKRAKGDSTYTKGDAFTDILNWLEDEGIVSKEDLDVRTKEFRELATEDSY